MNELNNSQKINKLHDKRLQGVRKNRKHDETDRKDKNWKEFERI